VRRFTSRRSIRCGPRIQVFISLGFLSRQEI
jgi:hypothetical protein